MRKNRMRLLTPDINTLYIRKSGKRQKARYMKFLPDTGEMLQEDIRTGAGIYRPFLEKLSLKESQYNVILAPTEEDGLRGIAYLAGVYGAADAGIFPGMADSPAMIDDEEDYFDLPIDEEELENMFSGIEDEDEDESFLEMSDRIPIIELSEVVAEENIKSMGLGFGNYNLESQNNSRKLTPWWNDIEEEAVCILKNRNNSGFMGGIFGGDTLSEDEISCLKRFSGNKKVYLLLVGDHFEEEDISIMSCALEYTANSFKVDFNEKNLAAYRENLLLDVAAKHGFSFAKDVDVKLLSEKLGKIDKQYPSRKYGQIMDYLEHVGAESKLKSQDFDVLGLQRNLKTSREDTTARTLEKELVGMEPVKKQIEGIMNLRRYEKARRGRGIHSQGAHNVYLFVGAPGTAKTTVAKMLAKEMQDEGLIAGDRFISITGAQLKGEYVGQTAPKVHAIFENYDAIFIDEAYSLTCSMGSEGGPDSYSQEALAQLAVELENHGTDKLVIFAGYGGREISKKNNLMYAFLQANPGISSRIQSTIYFDSYSAADMVSIVHKLAANAEMTLPRTVDGQIAAYFTQRRTAPDFGNGREARVFLEHCQRAVAERAVKKGIEDVSDKALNTITAADVSKTIQELEESRSVQAGQSGMKMGFR